MCEGSEPGVGTEGAGVGSPLPRSSSQDTAGGADGLRLRSPQLPQAPPSGAGDRPVQLRALVPGLDLPAEAAAGAFARGAAAHLAGARGLDARRRTDRSRRVATASPVAVDPGSGETHARSPTQRSALVTDENHRRSP